MDAVIRKWKGIGEYKSSRIFFYDDDGLLENEDIVRVQNNLENILALFDTLGLKANETKTKVMVFMRLVVATAMSTETYNKKCTKESKTFNEKNKKL